jgi:hypothetical protein
MMKKVFFAYSDDTEEILICIKELKQHFTAYARQGFLAIMDRDNFFRRSGNQEKYEEFSVNPILQFRC